eukprot:5786543-Pyramimonas_sp.AAC.1
MTADRRLQHGVLHPAEHYQGEEHRGGAGANRLRHPVWGGRRAQGAPLHNNNKHAPITVPQ